MKKGKDYGTAIDVAHHKVVPYSFAFITIVFKQKLHCVHVVLGRRNESTTASSPTRELQLYESTETPLLRANFFGADFV